MRNIRRILLTPLTAILTLAFSGIGFAESRVALVIGNGKYQHTNALPNPANDANAIAKTLGQIGFKVILATDLGRNAMENRLRDFLNHANSAQVALLFYAGHALQVDGRNFLVPVDAQIDTVSDLNFGTVDLERILAGLDDPNRANIVILDACRNNPLARSLAAKTRSVTVGAGLAAYTSVGHGSLIAFATAPGNVAADGDGSNSPFTQSLLKHMPTPGLEIRQMLTRVRADVAKATSERQIPWDNSSLRGDVYLVERSNIVDVAAASSNPAVESHNVSPNLDSAKLQFADWNGVWTGTWRQGRRPFSITITDGKRISYLIEGKPALIAQSKITKNAITFGGPMRFQNANYQIEITRAGANQATVRFKSGSTINATLMTKR